MTDSIRAVNSAVRTLLGLVLVGVVGTAGWFGYSAYVEPGRRLDRAEADLQAAHRLIQERDDALQKQREQILTLEQDVEAKRRLIAELETSLRLLKVDHRIAELRVLGQREDSETGRVVSMVEFVEINDEGAPIDEPKRFTIQGDLVYIEANVVQFQDEFVEQADPDRATSLCLFQRMYGEFQEPHEGFALDEVGTRPTAYARGGEMSEFEESIWQRFWEIANDPQLARRLGVRVAQKEAPGMKVLPGHTYRVTLRASGGLTIQMIEEPDSAAAQQPDA